jgi:hypothetical protein
MYSQREQRDQVLRLVAPDRPRALKVDAIDFDRQMIVGVSAGVQSGAGYRVELLRVEKDADKNRLTVFWKLVAPKKKNEGGLSHPAAVALVEKSDLPVRFAEEPVK